MSKWPLEPSISNVTDRREKQRGRPVWVEDAPIHATRLQRMLRDGRWAHQPPHRVSLPKSRGGTREISVFHPTEQALHRALSLCLGTWLEGRLCDSSMAFRRRRSVRMAVARADRSIRDGRAWATEIDVLACFDQVRHDLALASLTALGLNDAALLHLTDRCMQAGARWGAVGIAQGSALSPVLLNAHLHPVDEAMAGQAGQSSVSVRPQNHDPALAADLLQVLDDELDVGGQRNHPRSANPSGALAGGLPQIGAGRFC